MSRILLSLLLVCAALEARAESVIPTRFEAQFVLELENFGVTVGRSRWRLTPGKGNRFVWESQSRTAGAALMFRDVTIIERSESEYVDDGVRPLVYEYDRSGDDKARRLEIEFDWREGIARNTVKGDTWTMRLPDGTLDKINYLLMLMHDLALGKRRMSYTVADGGKLKTYDLKVEAHEQLDTALGELDTLRVRRIRDDERQTRVWCAPALGFMPVRVQHIERDGWVLTLSIESVEGVSLAATLQPPRLAASPMARSSARKASSTHSWRLR